MLISAIRIAAGLIFGTCYAQAEHSVVVPERLSPIHAELDPLNGGRFVDGEGREVLFSGVNVNSYGEYWQFDPDSPPVLPFTEVDMDLIQGMGWNVVRLLLTWSRVEPVPGEYDEGYLDTIEAVIRQLESRGIYTMIDLHQDAWGPHTVARDDENCPEGTIPASGWDGAPEWATLDQGAPRCYPDHPLLGEREFSPAVMLAFLSFWQDTEGPGGIGIQTRYHAMLTRLAKRFSPLDAVMGYDVMNEPNAWNAEILAAALPGQQLDGQAAYLSNFYEKALKAIRKGEEEAGSPTRLVIIEPSPDWQLSRPGVSVPQFEHDGQIAYSPHIYQGGIVPVPLDEEPFQRARSEAAAYGGIPILTGEWGSSPARALDPEDDYFERSYAYQDQFRIGGTLWLWHVACGDPHFAKKPYQGIDPTFWGFYDMECPGNKVLGFRDDYANALRRPLLRAAPGKIASVHWNYKDGNFSAAGKAASRGQKLLFFTHKALDSSAVTLNGLQNLTKVKTLAPGQIWSATTTGDSWALKVKF